jgi:hypothetical protein
MSYPLSANFTVLSIHVYSAELQKSVLFLRTAFEFNSDLLPPVSSLCVLTAGRYLLLSKLSLCIVTLTHCQALIQPVFVVVVVVIVTAAIVIKF